MGEDKRFGRYEVCGTIGRGAMGVVFLAEDPVIGRQVAIKVVETHAGLEEDELEHLQARFEREFQSAGRLSHPNIVGVHDVGQEDGNTFIAMEYVQGESLHSILAENRAFSFKEIADLTAQLCSGLDYAHEFGIVHRDIKPANILITRDGRPKITDFGVAKVATTTLTRTGTVVGTPAYMSPEQVTGHPVSGAADQFSLAVMVYQMLTGERPFTGENPTTIMYKIVHEQPLKPSALNAMVPEPVDRALIRALAKNPDERYPSCTELAEALRGSLGASPTDATVVMNTAHVEATVVDASLSQPPRETAASRRGGGSRVAGLVLAGLAAAALGVAGWWAWSNGLLEDSGAADTSPAAEAVPADVEVTRSLDIEASAGWEVWVNGIDSGVVTPNPVDLVGFSDQEIAVELRFGGSVLASEVFLLDDRFVGTWSPQGVDEAVAALAVDEEPAEEVGAAPILTTLTIVSSPAGATVTFDGEVLDRTTPVEIDVDLGEEHSVALALDGHDGEGWTFDGGDLSDEQRASGRLDFPLTSSVPPGFVSIDNPGYQIALTITPVAGGARRDFGAGYRHEISLVPGRYRVEMSAPAIFWVGESRSVTVESDRSVTLQGVRAVTVQVSAIPSRCTVTIDGVLVGPTPFPQRIAVGSHEVEFDWTAIGQGIKTVQVRVTSEGQQIREAADER